MSRLSQNLSTEFTPRLDGISLTGMSASFLNGILTISWNDLSQPHSDASQSSGETISNSFTNINEYGIEVCLFSGFTSGSAAGWPLVSSLNEYSYSVVNLSSSAGYYSQFPTSYNKESGVLVTAQENSSVYGPKLIAYPTTNWPGGTASIDLSAINASNAKSSWDNVGKLVSGNARVFARPSYRGSIKKFFSALSSYRYYGNYSNMDVNLSGANFPAPQGATLVAISETISGRTISWTDSSTVAGYYIYVYKWNGSAWNTLRQGYLADSYNGLGTGYQSYTIPAGDGAGMFFISVNTYSGYSQSFSGYISSIAYTL